MDQDFTSTHKRGRFELTYRDGWATLTVFPPQDASRKVYPEDVTARMELLGIPRVRNRLINYIIEEAAGEPRDLVEWPGGAALTGKVSVSISEDEMTGWVEISQPKKGGGDPDLEEIVSVLKGNGVVFGIQEDAIRKALAEHRYNTRIQAAEGLPAVHGEPPMVVFLFETERGKPYLQMDYGRINLRELNFVQNVRNGDTLAQTGGPTEPKDGNTVTGTVVPAEPAGESESFRPGTNTRFNGEGTAILSEIDGNVYIQHGKVNVEPVIHVKNVDYSTGNIDFNGTVIIDGSIADGFTVKAGGNIQIGKYAGKCTVEAGRNIILKAGMHGSNRGTIECRGDLYAKYIENAGISCQGTIFVEEAVMHCEVFVSGSLVLKGRRAEIIGGRVIAGKTVWCKQLGNMFETSTTLFIGVAPLEYREYLDAVHQLKDKEDLLNEVDEKIEQIQRHIHTLNKPEEKILLAQEQLKEESEELERETGKLRKNVRIHPLIAARDSMVVVEGTMHYGVSVHFGRNDFHPPHKGARKTVLRPGIKEIIESGYNRQEPPDIPLPPGDD